MASFSELSRRSSEENSWRYRREGNRTPRTSKKLSTVSSLKWCSCSNSKPWNCAEGRISDGRSTRTWPFRTTVSPALTDDSARKMYGRVVASNVARSGRRALRISVSLRALSHRASRSMLVPEMSRAGEHHGDARVIRRRDHLGILERPARLNDHPDPGLRRQGHAVREREEPVGGHRGATALDPGMLNRQPDRPHPAGLPLPDAHRG